MPRRSNRNAAKRSQRQSFVTTEPSSNSEEEERFGESDSKALIKSSSKKNQPVGKLKQMKKQKLVPGVPKKSIRIWLTLAIRI